MNSSRLWMVITLDERVSRLLLWKRGESPGPYGIELAPTLKCNLDCPFCWRQGADSLSFEGEMPLAKYHDILEQAAQLGVCEVKIIGGGEATVRKDTVDIMCAVKNHEMQGYLCTNGTLFTEEGVRRIVASGFDHVKMSFHAADAALGDEMLGRPGAFAKQMAALGLLAAAKSSLGMEKPFVELGVVLMNRNFRLLPEMLSVAAEQGADALFVEPITVYSERGEALKMNAGEREEFSAIAADAVDTARSLGIATNLDNYADGVMVEKTGRMQEVLHADAIPCFEPFLRMGIRYDGQVGPCGFLDQSSPDNVNNKSLSDIWHGEYFQQLRERMLNNNLLEQCARCCSTLVTNNRDLRDALGKEAEAEAEPEGAR